MIRTKRKINKQRGSRSNGGGCTKKRRGAGNKGVDCNPRPRPLW